VDTGDRRDQSETQAETVVAGAVAVVVENVMVPSGML